MSAFPDPSALLGATVVGVTGSVHCFLMCGPLACASSTSAKEGRWRAAVAYQGARALSYLAAGAIAGGIGEGVASVLRVSTTPYLPYVLAIALVCSALDLGRRLRPLPGFAGLFRMASRVSAKFSPALRAGAMGALTPLLPCGLLYAALLLAAATGSALGGVALMGAFALGAMPALAFAQLQKAVWRAENPVATFVLRRAVPVAAAAVLVLRAASTATAHAAGSAPHCH